MVGGSGAVLVVADVLEPGHDLALRQRYVRLKIDYWHAVEANDPDRAELISGEAGAQADRLTRAKKP